MSLKKTFWVLDIAKEIIMENEQIQILKMLEKGIITVDEADKLLEAVSPKSVPVYKHALFVPAVFLFLFSLSFSFRISEDSGNAVTWFWSEQPIVGVVLLLTSIALATAMSLDLGLLKRTTV